MLHLDFINFYILIGFLIAAYKKIGFSACLPFFSFLYYGDCYLQGKYDRNNVNITAIATAFCMVGVKCVAYIL